MIRITVASAIWLFLLVPFSSSAAQDASVIEWREWTDDLFDQAQAENRFVLLDLEAVWCHWCHVMEDETYATPQVVDLINARYIAVRVDQDANPDLAVRYGHWGWPATIVFAADGTEIVKRRGYIPPIGMIAMLQAIIDDPSPGPSVVTQEEPRPAESVTLDDAARSKLEADYWLVYDRDQGGWGSNHKFLDQPTMEYALHRAALKAPLYELMARHTLAQATNLIDFEWGGVYQYSDRMDWRSPHYEKIMLSQSTTLRSYALAFSIWDDERHLNVAERVYHYMTTRLMDPEGAFYTSQDADVNTQVSGAEFYALDAVVRNSRPAPRIDTNVYTRENGWAIEALLTYYDATGEEAALAAAEKAAHWIISRRAREGGGFAHGDSDRGGPFLSDNVAMVKAFVVLYASTGERAWLERARQTQDFIEATFRLEQGGYISHPLSPQGIGVFREPLRSIEENVAVARAANLVNRYSGEQVYRDMALHAMLYLGSPDLLEQRLFLHGVLLTDLELNNEPVHITVVGEKADASAQSLHTAARAYGAAYKRLEWWDRREGRLPNNDVEYPDLGRAAAFACSDRVCSRPIFDGANLKETVDLIFSAN